MKLPIIFIIEDSNVILELLTFTLQKQFDAHFVTYECAEEAIRGLDIYEPDVILLDYNLDSKHKSNMHGLNFLKKLEKLGVECPSIVMSNQRMRTTTADLLKHGAVSYISKEKDNFIDMIVDDLTLILDALQKKKELRTRQGSLRKFFFPILLLVIVPAILVSLLLFFM